MKLSQQSLSIIESAIQKAVAKYVCSCEQTVVTDIHLQPAILTWVIEHFSPLVQLNTK